MASVRFSYAHLNHGLKAAQKIPVYLVAPIETHVLADVDLGQW